MTEKIYKEYLDGTITFDLIYGVEVNGVIHKECEMREILGVDEENIAKPEIRSNVGKLITTLLSGCTLRIGELTPAKVGRLKWDKMINEMFMGDRDLMMLKLRMLSNGTSELKMDIECPHCSAKLTHIMDMESDIEHRELGDINPSGFSVKLPRPHRDEKTGEAITNVVLRMVTGDDQEQLDTVGRKNPGVANTMLLNRCIVDFGGEKPSPTLAKMLSTKNREFLITELTEKQFGPKLVLDITCIECGKEIQHGVHPLNFL